MTKVAVYSLTRDRFALTVECFERFWELGAVPDVEMRHFVIDNGSKDETPDWLFGRYEENKIAWLKCLPKNQGISGGEAMALSMIRAEETQTEEPFDVVVKFDNDCYIDPYAVGTVARIVVVAAELGDLWVLSPVVWGLDRPPRWESTVRVAGVDVGEVGHVGGICRCSPGGLALGYEPNMGLPKAWGQDEDFSVYARAAGARIGYVQNVHVHHHLTTAGQAKRFPEYFERKTREEGPRDAGLIRGRKG